MFSLCMDIFTLRVNDGYFGLVGLLKFFFFSFCVLAFSKFSVIHRFKFCSEKIF